jgi:carbonic anhydrase/acetyltransferase-like protein (isoleucine patch superfamily)
MQSVTLEDYVVVAVRATLLPGGCIGQEGFITVHSLVGQEIPEDSLVSDSPAKRSRKASGMRLKNDVRVRAYLWPKRFV